MSALRPPLSSALPFPPPSKKAPKCAQAARTDLVNGRGLSRFGAPGSQRDLPRGALSNTGLEHVAEVDILDLGGGDSGLGEDTLDGRDSELDRRNLGEHALERSDGGTGLGTRRGGVRRGGETEVIGDGERRTAPTMKTSGNLEGVWVEA